MSAGRSVDGPVTVHLPDELPVLTRRGWRILLEVLVELAADPVEDGPGEGGSDDS
ncbi:hypothetical protein [Alloactinosynnema sp. L-07]|nr:hypothetical protein [Alloactinosynnema sp. L-07]